MSSVGTLPAPLSHFAVQMLLAHRLTPTVGERRPEGCSAVGAKQVPRRLNQKRQPARRSEQPTPFRVHAWRHARTWALAAGSGGGAAEAPPHPSRLRLGADIPIALRPFTVDDGADGCTFLLVVPDIDAGEGGGWAGRGGAGRGSTRGRSTCRQPPRSRPDQLNAPIRLTPAHPPTNLRPQ